MHQNAILRWPHGYSWGHLSLCTADGKPQFIGFVRLADKRVQALIDRAIQTRAEGDMREVTFTVPAAEMSAAPVYAGT